MATESNFVSIPLNGRDVSDLERQLREHAGLESVSLVGATSNGQGSITVRVPTDPDLRSEVLRIVQQWRDG